MAFAILRNCHLTGRGARPIFWSRKGQSMVSMRVIVALLVALSVAMLPVAGGIAAPASVPSNSKLVTSAHDCCDHDGMPSDDMTKDCQAAAGCASKCFSLYDGMFASPVPHPPVTRAKASFGTEPFRSQEGNPPFRPPRV